MSAYLVRIRDDLDVAPALTQLESCGDHWIELSESVRQINLLDHEGGRLLEAELGSVWALIDSVVEASVRTGGGPRLTHARVGLMRTGERLPPHFDGIDGVKERRFQIPLLSEEGVAFTIAGETRRFLPGEAWQIDVSATHSVVNASSADRITILFDTVLARETARTRDRLLTISQGVLYQ